MKPRELGSRANKVAENLVRMQKVLAEVDRLHVEQDPRKLGITPADRKALMDWVANYRERAAVIIDEESK